MKRSASATAARLVFLSGYAALLFCVSHAAAADFPGARISRVLKDVMLAPAGSGARAVKAGDFVPEGATVRTGAEARAEITLPGPAVARLGGRSSLRVTGNGSQLELGEGLVLFQVPKQGGGMTCKTGAINVSGRGGTGLMERYGGAYVKILVLEGEARVYTARVGESIVMAAGQLLITVPKAEGLPEPVHFDIEHLYKTSLLTNSDFAPLATRVSILEAIQKQKNDPQFIPTNLVIFGRGTIVSILPPTPTPARPARARSGH